MLRLATAVACLFAVMSIARAEVAPRADCDVSPQCFFSGKVELNESCRALAGLVAEVWHRARGGRALGWCRSITLGETPLPLRVLEVEIRGFGYQYPARADNQKFSHLTSPRRVAALLQAIRIGTASSRITRGCPRICCSWKPNSTTRVASSAKARPDARLAACATERRPSRRSAAHIRAEAHRRVSWASCNAISRARIPAAFSEHFLPLEA
jgi:hypothetical protein